MQEEIDDRIRRQLDQLEDPGLADKDIDRIQRKVEFLQSLKE